MAPFIMAKHSVFSKKDKTVKSVGRWFSQGVKRQLNFTFAPRMKSRRLKVFLPLSAEIRIPFGNMRGRKQLGDFISAVCSF